MTKIIITILAVIVIIDALIAYACCVVAGRADDVAETWEDRKEEKRENESTDQSSGRDHR